MGREVGFDCVTAVRVDRWELGLFVRKLRGELVRMVFCETEPIGWGDGFVCAFFEARPTRLGSQLCVWDFAKQSQFGSALGYSEHNSLIVGCPACA